MTKKLSAHDPGLSPLSDAAYRAYLALPEGPGVHHLKQDPPGDVLAELERAGLICDLTRNLFGGASFRLPSPIAAVLVRVPDLGKPASKAKAQLVERHLALCLSLLDRLNAERGLVLRGAGDIRPTYASLAGIAGRLDAGHTAADCEAVIRRTAAEVRRDPSAGRWFDSVTPFREANFQRRLDQPERTPGRPGYSPPVAHDGGVRRVR